MGVAVRERVCFGRRDAGYKRIQVLCVVRKATERGNDMNRYTYSLYDRHGNKTKTVTCTSSEPVGAALETYITSSTTPQYLAEINVMLERIEDCDENNIHTHAV